MKKYPIALKTGTRNSNLAVIQSHNACRCIERLFPFLKFELAEFSTPGDRDKITDLQTSSDDFFSKDLDDAILNNQIACAVHSAKDLPYPMKDGLDWFWLPWKEDARDVIVGNGNNNPIIGVSSERREKYSLKRWPKAVIKPIRGNIEERLQQLDNGSYDILIMAAAALKRLNLQHRISEYIPVIPKTKWFSETYKINEDKISQITQKQKYLQYNDITPPEGQGYIAVTFKANNRLFQNIRKYFVKPVVFAGAGPGNPELISIGAVKALSNCEICLYDSLISKKLLDYLPASAKSVFVGKRNGYHSIKQHQINQLISDYSRQGKKVVRLKGGDPGIFGRLTEETDILNKLELPYRIIPGISSINTAASTSGLLLTRRDVSRGFTVATCRLKNSKAFVPVSKEETNSLTKVFLMSVSFIPELTESLIETGAPKQTPISVIFNAGCIDEKIICSTLDKIVATLENIDKSGPGIILVGESSDKKYLFKNNGALSGHRVLLTCSENIIEKAAERVLDYGGIPILKPMIKLQTNHNIGSLLGSTINQYDWLIITSPGSVNCFMDIISKHSIDIRTIPKIIVCGKGTAEELGKYNLIADAVAKENYGTKGLLEIFDKNISLKSKVLRLKSNISSNTITETLLKKGYDIKETDLYETVGISYNSVWSFDSVVFASSSAVNGFIKNFGIDKLINKTVVVFGKPTEETLKNYNPDCTILVNSSSTITGCIDLISLNHIIKKIKLDQKPE